MESCKIHKQFAALMKTEADRPKPELRQWIFVLGHSVGTNREGGTTILQQHEPQDGLEPEVVLSISVLLPCGEGAHVGDLACFAHNLNTLFFPLPLFVFQQQLAKNIKFGQPPQMTISGRTMGEANASVEEDAFLGSLMEIDSQQDTVLSESGNKVSTSNWRFHGFIVIINQ